jgi:hypothetical protein
VTAADPLAEGEDVIDALDFLRDLARRPGHDEVKEAFDSICSESFKAATRRMEAQAVITATGRGTEDLGDRPSSHTSGPGV